MLCGVVREERWVKQIRIASEDVGLGDSSALPFAVAAHQVSSPLSPSIALLLGHAIMALFRGRCVLRHLCVSLCLCVCARACVCVCVSTS
eukprot:3108060-Rhodomonas_salina.2